MELLEKFFKDEVIKCATQEQRATFTVAVTPIESAYPKCIAEFSEHKVTVENVDTGAVVAELSHAEFYNNFKCEFISAEKGTDDKQLAKLLEEIILIPTFKYRDVVKQIAFEKIPDSTLDCLEFTAETKDKETQVQVGVALGSAFITFKSGNTAEIGIDELKQDYRILELSNWNEETKKAFFEAGAKACIRKFDIML